MRLMVLHGKKVFTVLVLFLLMGLMMFGETKLHDRLKLSTFTQNNIQELKQYSDSEKTLKYLLPVNWQTKEESFGGGEIIYHNNFKSPDGVINGYVEIWNSKKKLKEFLEQSKDISEKQNKIINYSMEKLETDKGNGYLITYEIEVTPGNIYRAEEYFIERGNKFIRFSFFVNKKNFTSNMSRIFKTIVDTVKFQE
ncbi:PsbP-related protein [Hathewaya histolytica]|uniref:Membrane-associated protein n=1 Tax=Hathewaya histolytica TaxID=1498 RepID=A0A4U9RQG9_HATHI|nr:PsbP-related protein [Hathewaya histolytica]VTQ94502.1 membrane-associated protein [Hathewaya histolytica]